jgi:hypothetical protein
MLFGFIIGTGTKTGFEPLPKGLENIVKLYQYPSKKLSKKLGKFLGGLKKCAKQA